MPTSLAEILALPVEGRIEPLAQHARGLSTASGGVDNTAVDSTVEAILALIEDGSGTGRQRVELGEALGLLRDPRLRRPGDPDYWAKVTMDDDSELLVGRFMVTTAEWTAFLADGYNNDANWSADGLTWRDHSGPSWQELAQDPTVANLVVPNQPVVGVTWFEAEAYANANGARMLTNEERKWVVRGSEKRPYPWGAPFGAGNANSREEAIGRPTAVGLYRRDRTPEGVWDLAANAGEWTGDRVGDQCIFHPGSWARPSMAAWAKALELTSPSTRSSDLGFRLAKDPS